MGKNKLNTSFDKFIKNILQELKLNTPNLKSLSIPFLFILIFIFSGCAEKQVIQIEEKAMCEQEKFGFEKLKQVTHCDNDTCITNPEIRIWNKPFQIGDTIMISVSAKFTSFDEPLIYGKPVYVSIKSGSGDQETFLLDGKSLPGETRLVGIQIFRIIIPYSVDHSNPPVLGNNLLEIRPTGDTLIASYRSYCTNAVVEDTAVIIPK
ncbi:MAG: hypothetical protein HF308_15465 [Ignavibacteria bacterium]|jgi:hypothetical protein|nr:hypothetical protein [Ignavibacteria bacterium]MCU7522493.1 hypothetical protein [Ignavibacteria bacterium]MCU7525877.1 hypothetical protein [Ignavibacteria bacterium]